MKFEKYSVAGFALLLAVLIIYSVQSQSARSEAGKIAVVGDSWAFQCPDNLFDEPPIKYAYPGVRIAYIVDALSKLPSAHFDRIYIIGGVANYRALTLIDGIPEEEALIRTQLDIGKLAATCEKKFGGTVIVCDLPRMLEWRSKSENQALSGILPEWHLRPGAYPSLLMLQR